MHTNMCLLFCFYSVADDSELLQREVGGEGTDRVRNQRRRRSRHDHWYRSLRHGNQ